MTINDPAVSVVVPVRNEAGNIASLWRKSPWRSTTVAFEVIYVNDGSSDDTEAETHAADRFVSWLRRVRHKESCASLARCAAASLLRAQATW